MFGQHYFAKKSLPSRVLRSLRRRRERFVAAPHYQVTHVPQGPFQYQSEGPMAQLQLRPQSACPTGWVYVRAELLLETGVVAAPRLYCDTISVADHYEPDIHAGIIELPAPREGHIEALCFIPSTTRFLRFAPEIGSARFSLSSFSVQQMSAPEAALRLSVMRLATRAHRPADAWHFAKRGVEIFRQDGFAGLLSRLSGKNKATNDDQAYARWIERYDALSENDCAVIKSRLMQLPMQPTFSIVMPVYNTDERWLRAAIASVKNQLYPFWELCIADDQSTQPHVTRVLKEFQRSDARMRVMIRGQNGHISAATNSAMELATGDFIVFLDHDDELAPHALYMLAEELVAHPEAAMLYSDEDKIDEQGRRFDPHFKSDWNPDLLLGQNYLGHMVAYRRDVIEQAQGVRLGYEGAQDYDLALRASADLTPEQIRHIPFVLYHWRAISGSTAQNSDAKDYALVNAQAALQSHLDEQEIAAAVEPAGQGLPYHRIRYELKEQPLVSLIVPTRDKVDLLRACVESILRRTTYGNYEILVVDNNSQESATKRYLKQISKYDKVRVLSYPEPFNFAAMNNFAARQARGSILGLVNNDIEVISPNWLQDMVQHAVRAEVGAVGAQLYYADDTIQHAGVTLGICGVAGHNFKRQNRGSRGYMSRAQLTQNVAAVTAACLLVRKALYEQVGGLDEEFAVALNDVDFCLKLLQIGFRNVYVASAQLYHKESASRGREDTAAKQQRFNHEVELLTRRWGEWMQADPYYNPNLTLEREDFGLAEPPRVHRPWLQHTRQARYGDAGVSVQGGANFVAIHPPQFPRSKHTLN